jgi:hypothetical protein
MAGLTLAQRTAAQAFHSDAARLDHDEAVNGIGRPG